MAQKIPSKLYKYQPYNIQTLDNLKNRQIWFSKSEKFNDPFDYSGVYDFGSPNLSKNDLNKLHRVLRNHALDKEQFDQKYSENKRPNSTFEQKCISLAEIEVRKKIKKSSWYWDSLFC